MILLFDFGCDMGWDGASWKRGGLELAFKPFVSILDGFVLSSRIVVVRFLY